MPSPLGLPCGWPALEQPRRDELKRRFHVPHLPQDGLGPLCTPAVQRSRRATFESPNLTAYLLVQALISLVWLVLCDDAYECSNVLTMPHVTNAVDGQAAGVFSWKGHVGVAQC